MSGYYSFNPTKFGVCIPHQLYCDGTSPSEIVDRNYVHRVLDETKLGRIWNSQEVYPWWYDHGYGFDWFSSGAPPKGCNDWQRTRGHWSRLCVAIRI